MNHVFFSGELFSRGCLQTYMLTYSGTISPILFLSPWKLTKSTRAEWPLTLYMQFPAPQRILSTLWDHQVPAGPDVQQLLTPVTARITGHSPPPCVITTVHGVLRQRNAELPAPGRETSSPAGGCSYPTCRAFYLVSSNLSSRFQELQMVFPDQGSSGRNSGVKLLTADGSSLTCSGSRIIPLQFRNHKFEWPFQLATVAIPILGADFLKHYNLLLDVSNQRVRSLNVAITGIYEYHV